MAEKRTGRDDAAMPPSAETTAEAATLSTQARPNLRRARPIQNVDEETYTSRDLIPLLNAMLSTRSGDFSVRLPLRHDGSLLDEMHAVFNQSAAVKENMALDIRRVARSVGREGRMDERASFDGLEGEWRAVPESVNALIENLALPTTEVTRVLAAVASGDLSQQMALEIDGMAVQGEFLRIRTTVNTMVEQLRAFASEVTRVAREVGTEGKLGGQASVPGVAGTWKDLTDNVNGLATNLTIQLRDVSKVATAIASGDLTQKITVDVQGEMLQIKAVINQMVDQLSTFAAEVTRVAREVGTEGILGGQAEVKGVAGTWKDLTDNVNGMAGNLTSQVRNVATVTTAVANGDLTQKITVDARGEILELKNTINTMVDQLNSFASEVSRVAREVGTEGRLGGQAQVKDVAGTWKDLTDNVNGMAGNLTSQVRNVATVTTAVANGDLTQKITVDARGEILELKNTINQMVDQLSTFAAEVTRVAREVGTEGILGGQAEVKGVAGTWKDLTDSVNGLATNLTIQLRDMSKVSTAIASGDLTQKITVDVRGEMLQIKAVINQMVDQLSTFAAEVTRVAREVGIEGKLGGQAQVQGVAGTWKDLTDNVNGMAASLTAQVRAISDVATAVAEGDLSRSITVEAQGEVSALKDNINRMIGNLKETTDLNNEQDWLKTNLARFGRMMQGVKDLQEITNLIMSELTPLVSAHHGAFYIDDHSEGERVLKLLASYAFRNRKSVANRFYRGEGLIGQCALEKKSILLTNVPTDYIQINSGLGEATPLNIIVLPVLFEGEVMAVIELASFQRFSEIHINFLEQLMETVGVVLNMIAANQRTEQLLSQSQTLTQELQSQSQELQSQQEKLRQSNIELAQKASQLAEQNIEVENKNKEVEMARSSLEEKAEQLALSSKYKSEFLANMSHELRTPLNSMLILAKLLADNPDQNLTPKQTEFAQTIYTSGGDLLSLINEILDLSKVEAGKMEVEVADLRLADLKDYIERTFAQVAANKHLEFSVELDETAPDTLRTDAGRLQQILKNLLSNALKFTERGGVQLAVRTAKAGEFPDLEKALSTQSLGHQGLVAFTVSDSGIGIAPDKQRLIFEAFQQADGSTSRQYGGTGLGLSISREITRILGGRIYVQSELGRGSEFTLVLPQTYRAPDSSGNTVHVQSDSLQSDGVQNNAGDNKLSAPMVRPQVASMTSGIQPPSNGTAALSTQTSLSTQNSEPVIADDRDNLGEGDRVLLVIEDDVSFARIMVNMAREKGFKVLASLRGDEGLAMAQRYVPDAIALDLQLPVMDGWQVLDRLKRDPKTRHIPVQVISVMDRERGAAVGAISYIEKPVSAEALEGALTHMGDFLQRDVRRVLVVEDEDVQRQNIRRILSADDVEIVEAKNGEAALEQLESGVYDCMVLDLGLPDMAGFELLKKVREQPRRRNLPIVIHTSRDLTPDEERQLKKYAERIVTKDARAPEKLLDETAMFLHRVFHNEETPSIQNLSTQPNAISPIAPQEMASQTLSAQESVAPAVVNSNIPANSVPAKSEASPQSAEGLAGRHILIVDDDVRNVFALTSALENYGLRVSYAEGASEAVAFLGEHSDVELILMDVMMPGTDGLTATANIHALPEYSEIPIIAVTAKAMAGDRERSLEAGASDYLTKPVDLEILLQMLERFL